MQQENNELRDGRELLYGSLRQDFTDVKQFVHAEVLSMEARVVGQTNADSGKKSSSVERNFEQLFIKSLQDRITSLDNNTKKGQHYFDILKTFFPTLIRV